jgi:hypothetical protein
MLNNEQAVTGLTFSRLFILLIYLVSSRHRNIITVSNNFKYGNLNNAGVQQARLTTINDNGRVYISLEPELKTSFKPLLNLIPKTHL